MTKDTSKLPDHNIEEDEIDLIALAKTLWNGRKTVIKTTIIFMAIGLFIAIFSEKEYSATTTFVPQISDDNKLSGSLSGLAAMAGINIGGISSESGISPALYPEIINSILFQKELLQTPLTIEGQSQPVSFTEYYTTIYSPGILGYIKKYTIGLPGLLIKAVKGDSNNEQSHVNNQIETITEDEKELIDLLDEQIILVVDDKDGYINLTVNMPEALAAAQMAKKTQELLQKYIIDFKIKKSLEQLRFIEDRYNEKEKKFKKAQQNLAGFRDRNRNTNSALAQTTLESLQSEYDLDYSVFSELAKQVEAQKIQVKEDTPVFTIVKPVFVPLEKSKPNRLLILIIWIFLGGIVGLGRVFSIDIYAGIKEKWNVKN